MKFELRPIAPESVGRALERAERYRLLNEPFLAESICLDILAIEPEHQAALVCYVLALTDQFHEGLDGGATRARAAVQKLASEYERAYYSGLIAERRGHARLSAKMAGARDAAWEYLVEAMDWYEKALPLRPEKNDDAILRSNTCVRLIETHRLTAPHHERDDFTLE
jgi:hypothetical protein